MLEEAGDASNRASAKPVRVTLNLDAGKLRAALERAEANAQDERAVGLRA